MKIIKVPHGENGKLAAFTGCTVQYVNRCLKGQYDTDLANLVRYNAMKYFHGEVYKTVTNHKS